MKRLQINDKKLAAALRRMAPETGSLICLGCGYERNCSIHGCAVLRAAADRLAELSAPSTNPPLTVEELREMDGAPVWTCHPLDKHSGTWAFVDIKFDMCREAGGGIAVFENYGKTWLAYRRKPEEETT